MERFADWLTGGALTRLRVENAALREECEAQERRLDAYSTALAVIAVQETPAANATVRRMAKIARDALK